MRRRDDGQEIPANGTKIPFSGIIEMDKEN
jgi:hypothetical protein